MTPQSWFTTLLYRFRYPRGSVEQRIKQGASLAFAHGLNIHYDLIKARDDLDVFMIAPKGPGHLVRTEYQKGGGVPCLMAVHKDSTGKAKDLALSYASAVGGGRSGIIETTFNDESWSSGKTGVGYDNSTKYI